MDYSTGTLSSMSSNLFPPLREEPGPYLVDKTKLIENLIVDGALTGGGVDLVLQDVVENLPCCKCSSNYVALYPLSALKLCDQVFFLHPLR